MRVIASCVGVGRVNDERFGWGVASCCTARASTLVHCSCRCEGACERGVQSCVIGSMPTSMLCSYMAILTIHTHLCAIWCLCTQGSVDRQIPDIAAQYIWVLYTDLGRAHTAVCRDSDVSAY